MEKTYKLMKFCGGAGIAIGVVMIVVGWKYAMKIGAKV